MSLKSKSRDDISKTVRYEMFAAVGKSSWRRKTSLYSLEQA